MLQTMGSLTVGQSLESKQQQHTGKLKKKELYQIAYFSVCVCVCVSCSVMSNFCRPMDCGPPGSSVNGVLQARILEWIDIPFSRGSS